MAYFSNGTQMDLYEENFCFNCIHGEGEFCPIMEAHMLFMTDAIQEGEDSAGVNILLTLIPEDKDTVTPLECTMRVVKQ